MKKLFLILFCAILISSCIGYAKNHLTVRSIESCNCPEKYKVAIQTNEEDFYLYTDTYYKVGDTLK